MLESDRREKCTEIPARRVRDRTGGGHRGGEARTAGLGLTAHDEAEPPRERIEEPTAARQQEQGVAGAG